MTRRFKQPIWIFPLVIAGVVALFGWWANNRLRQIVQEQVRAKLVSTLEANVTALEIWTTNQTRLATSIAEDTEVQKLATRILDRSSEVSAESPRLTDSQDSDQLAAYLRRRIGNLGYPMAQLVNTNFMLVGSSSRARLGNAMLVSEAHTNKFEELFHSGEPILITPFKPELPRRRPQQTTLRTNAAERPLPFPNRRPSRNRGTNDVQRRRGDITLMQVAAPIRSGGIVRGALALVINPANEFSRILSVARTGETGETYAFDQTGLLISQSRFIVQLHETGLLYETNWSSALNLRLFDPGYELTPKSQRPETNAPSLALTRIVTRAIEGEDGVEVESSRDYRGVPVVGAWRWLPELGFGVATQIDAEEAYRPLRVLQLIFVVLFLLLVLCAVSMFLFSYANVTWQKRLSEAQLKLKQLGQYTLEEKIGEGGMGTVYRARHALMRRETAVKLLTNDPADTEATERFEREVCLTCQLSHPNTIQVYDYGHTPDGIFYYAMEYLRGLNLQQLVARYGPQSEGRVIHILAQVCDSLAEAHALGLVHRDIKPANIFLCDRGGIPDAVKVLDFGLVREYKRDGKEKLNPEEKTGIVGTPWFMPPEAFKDSSHSNPRNDIYSVGAVAYFLLTGRFAFEANSVSEIYEMQMTQSAAAHFATTRWSLVLNAGQQSTAESAKALETLCSAYWFPLYAYARRKGYAAEDASDLTQEFFLRLLEKQFLESADPERGRFRTFLLTVFQRFLLKERDRDRAIKRGGGLR
ncbi:MAG: protein kinase, partial [Akkermansiaceae bacterium]|nr:protein kinase [Verrucomicrobiales bacterium]